MNTYTSQKFTVQAGQSVVVKEAGVLYYRLKVVNNSDSFISILIHNQDGVNETVIDLKNGVLDFEDDEPKNKISLKNDTAEIIEVTLMWRV